MTTFEREDKVNILLTILKERYASIHIIRERVQSISLWSLGIFLTTSGWLIQSSIILSIEHKILYTIFLLIGFIAIKFYYLDDLEKGFKNQFQVATKIEKALKLYDVNAFDDSGSSLFPKEWENAGNNVSKGNFFNTNINLLKLGLGILLFSIWLHNYI